MSQSSEIGTALHHHGTDHVMEANEQVRRMAAELAGRCESRVNQLARELAERHFAVIPNYADLPEDMRDLEMAGTARHAIRQFLQTAAGAPTSEDDFRLFRERAAQRAEEGVELTTLLRTYHIGAEVIWEALCDAARPGEEPALLWLARHQLRGLNRTVIAVTEAYQAEQSAILAEKREAYQEVARALLTGETAHAIAARNGIALAPAFLVLNLHVAGTPPHGETLGAGVPISQIIERRTLRQVRARLEGFTDVPPLTLLDARGGHVLLPLSAAERMPELGRLLASIGPGAEQIIAGAARTEGTADVPRAADQAVRIARIAQSTGRPPGVYELDDVLLDYHLSGQADSGRALAALLDPLDEHPELVETLHAFLDHDLDRRRTAQALAVHPNTVDNRLSRAAGLLGVDLQTTRGLMLCATALTLRRLG
ncbi:helix-turn-helix domain-containing protein [Actinomadura barringtoniae]|uniref:Helix-turn-helix domain-containing protein n=1 Tax=Actinomadura barringtoniae TaxID=1427535 RepID=A0A939PNN9_9ACTN|nr:helix-turn-helix domain-containing protein [Actinomadura barringtoniae]MBO2453269.1 helix-turn-helix domain-containing protein [Actinomadura barringtoniae]